jgi:hypothetical protein
MSRQIFSTVFPEELSATSADCGNAKLPIEHLTATRSSGTDADGMQTTPGRSGSSVLYLASVGMVGAVTAAIFFGTGFLLLGSSGSRAVLGAAVGPALESAVPTGSQPTPAGSDNLPVATSLGTGDKVQNSVTAPAITAVPDKAAEEDPSPFVQSGESSKPNPNSAPPPVPPTASSFAVTTRVPSPSRITAAEITDLLERGDVLLRTGDVTSARLFYERAAAAGDGRAALRLGISFEPAFLERIGVPKEQADVAAARMWCGRALDLGVPEAKRQLDNLASKEGRN